MDFCASKYVPKGYIIADKDGNILEVDSKNVLTSEVLNRFKNIDFVACSNVALTNLASYHLVNNDSIKAIVINKIIKEIEYYDKDKHEEEHKKKFKDFIA